MNLSGVDLSGAKLEDYRNNYCGIIKDFISFDNVGSRKSRAIFIKTDKDIYVQTGCFYDNLDTFIKKVKEKHRKNKYAEEYFSIIELVKKRFKYKKENKRFFKSLKNIFTKL